MPNNGYFRLFFGKNEYVCVGKIEKNAGYGYVKNRIFAQNGIFGAEMAQKISKMTNFGPIKGRSAQNMGPINFRKIQKLFLLME